MAHDPYRLQRQTQAKHALLQHYLPRWAIVLSQVGHQNLMYIDGFAFAGKYTSDEDGGPGGPGSPLVALRCFKEVDPAAKGLFLFIDKKAQYVEELEKNIESWPHKRPQDRWKCRHGSFEQEVQTAIASLEERAKTPGRRQVNVIPAFVLIDPYGTTGFPMTLMRRLLALPRVEVFINLMWVRTAQNLNLKMVQDAESFTKMLGDDSWRGLLQLRERALADAFHDLYVARLRDSDGANAGFVRSFEMRSKDGSLAYWMLFATNHRYGLEKMKEAMWKVDPAGGFLFHDTTARGQSVLFEPSPSFATLRRLLLDRFRGVAGVRVEDLVDYVVCETPFLTSHIKRRVLGPLEREGQIVVHRPGASRRGFVDGTTIDFPGAP